MANREGMQQKKVVQKSKEPVVNSKKKENKEKTNNDKIMEIIVEESGDDLKPGWFHANKKYKLISMYALFVIACGAGIYFVISKWPTIKHFIYQLVNVLQPFFLAVLFAYFISPILEKLEVIWGRLFKQSSKVVGKYISMLLAYLIVIGFVIVAIVFVVPQIGESVKELTNNLPTMYQQVSKFLMKVQKDYPGLDMQFLSDKLKTFVPNLLKFGTNIMGDFIPFVYSLSVSIVRIVINIILGLMISMYMLSGKNMFRHQAKRLVYAVMPEKKGDEFCKTCRDCNNIFSAFLISKALDSFIIGCLCCLIMTILRLPYGVLLSVIVGITNMIPYFGPFIGAVPGILIYLCTEPRQAIIFAIMILALQQFDGLVLGPRLLGQSTGLNPIWVIFAITVGGAYFGVLGMFIGVPVVAVIAFLIDKVIDDRLKGKKIKALQEFEKNK